MGLIDAASFNGVSSRLMQSLGSRGYAAAPGIIASRYLLPHARSRLTCSRLGNESGGASSTRAAKPKLLGGRYGSRLRRAGKADDFARMNTILGFGQPLGQAAGKVEKVTISTLQTLKYLQVRPCGRHALPCRHAYHMLRRSALLRLSCFPAASASPGLQAVAGCVSSDSAGKGNGASAAEDVRISAGGLGSVPNSFRGLIKTRLKLLL